MGTLPQAYLDFAMNYAPFTYVVPTAITQDAASDQKTIQVADGSKFKPNFPAQIKDSAHSEYNEIQNVNDNTLTLKNNLANSYHKSKNAQIEAPNPEFGKTTLAAAFAIEFLSKTYTASQFSSTHTEILAKISSLADWLLTQQCQEPARVAYGGFKNTETATEYWSIDAGRAIPALLTAYELTENTNYLHAAQLAGYTFLYNMQNQPFTLGINDKYFGGFAQSVTISEAWGTNIPVENLYCLIGLKMLAEKYDKTNASRYNKIMLDLASFIREGFEAQQLFFYPKPSGDNQWHRIGINDTEVYDDPLSFALHGLYQYEGWSPSCQQVYNSIQGIKANGQFPGYNPDICWAGYIDVVSRYPTCSYYDSVTIGILERIRKEHDPPSYKLAHDIAETYSEEFLTWGPIFTDYSPIVPEKAMANVAWIGQMFLNYQEPTSHFTKILKRQCENILLFPMNQNANPLKYGKPQSLSAIVLPFKEEQILIEPGYYLNDYLAIYTFFPVRVHDKIRHQGKDYEIQTVTTYRLANKTFYYKSTARRLLSS